MDPVTLHVTIDRPREEVFAYLADVANHPEFSDHFLKSWRLTREDSAGRGAGARYKQDARFDRFGYYDLSIAEVDPPYRIIAVGRGGKYNRTKTFHQWTLEPDHGGTRLEYVYETEPPLPDRQARRGAQRPPRLVPARRREGPAAAPQHPRGEPGSRRPGDRLRSRLTRPMSRLARLVLLCAAALAAVVASGCGNKEDVVTLAETEGIYVTVDDVKYQIQISRILNPAAPDDSAYLRGVPEDEPLQDDEVWYGDLHAGGERQRRPAPDRRELQDHRHAGQRVRADRDRSGGERLRLRADRAAAGQADSRRSTRPRPTTRSRAG